MDDALRMGIAARGGRIVGGLEGGGGHHRAARPQSTGPACSRIGTDETQQFPLPANTVDRTDSASVEGADHPEGQYPLYAGGRTAFVTEGDVIVAHGGPCIEEVIVPFVQVSRRLASS